MDKILFNFSLIIFSISASQILGKNLTKYKIINENNMEGQTPRNLESDNYMVIYFNKDCKYSSGFVNIFRNDIDFIINKKNYLKYKKESPFSVTKDYGIEIHFGKAINSLYRFFNYYNYDENMRYLVFVDLSKFDSSKVTSINGMFEGCFSLESIDLSNFDTSKVTDMNSMFYACSSLKSIDLSNFNTSKVNNMRSMFSG